MKKNTVWIILVILAVIAAVAYGLAWRRDSAELVQEQENGQEASPGTDETPEEASTSTPSGSGGTQAPKRLTYGEALAMYGPSGTGFMYQFVTCNGRPGKLAMKKGTKFLLDNRDDKAHTIVVKSQTFRLGAYGFAVATAKDVGTYNITCDGGGAAEITVQP